VVAKVAYTSFKVAADASGNRVTWSAIDKVWSLSSPSGDTVSFSSDFARNTTSAGLGDVEFSFDAAPFIAAGLLIESLPKTKRITYEFRDGRFLFHFELGAEAFETDAQKSIDAQVETMDEAGKTVAVDKLLKPFDVG
jgi:hypothetical protein